jgi:hypothetical protein
MAVAGVVTAVPDLAGAAGRAPALRSGPTEDAPLGRAERVLVFSVPTLSWADLEGVDAPHITGLLSQSVVADLSVRSVSRHVTPADGYATFGAGTRTSGTPFASLAFAAGRPRQAGSDADGDPVEAPAQTFDPAPGEDPSIGAIFAPTPEEPVAGDAPAGVERETTPVVEEFTRRTGVTPSTGELFNFGLPSMLAVNDRLLFDAEVGAMGTALREAGVGRAVIANGDHDAGKSAVAYRREATVGLMDGDGLVTSGRVGRNLLMEDADAPFGVRLDPDQVDASFEEFWLPRSVVLVEASDMVRAEDAAQLAVSTRKPGLRRQAIEYSDELLGRLLQRVDLDADAVMLVAPWAQGSGNSLTVVGVRAPGVEAGLLSSGTTRRAGFVQTVDAAPTILSLVGVEVPSSMEGTVMERKATGGDFAERSTFLMESNEAAHFRDSLVGPASAVFVIAQVLLWVAALVVMSRPGSLGRSGLEVCTLVVLAFLPMTFLAGALPVWRWGTSAYWVIVVAGSAVLGLAAWLPLRRGLVDPLLAMLGGIVVFLSVDIALGGPLQMNTVFGYTPTVAGRFHGMGNPAFSIFVASSVVVSALVAHRIGGRRGAWAGIGVLVWAVVLDAAPVLGADVGGGLALVPTVAITSAMLLGRRIRLGVLALWSAAAVVVVTLLGLLDLLRPPAERTHLGRLLADIGDNGFGAFETVVLRKLDANLSVLVSSVWTLMLPAVFLFVGFVFWKAPWRLRRISEEIPEERAALAGLLVAMVLGFALNDSGIAVPAIMMGVASASLIHLMLRVDDIPERDAPDLPGGDADRSDGAGVRGGAGGQGPGDGSGDAGDGGAQEPAVQPARV